jgi:TIGR03009 family protein
MSRNLGVGRLLGLMLLGAVWALPVALFGQDAASPEGGSQTPGRIDRGIAREDSVQPQGGSQSPGRVDRSQLTQPDLRADAADPNTGKPIDPRIEALLEVWSKRTKEIKRLQGSHTRSVRDFSWGTETVAEGKFYVETPDKGRFDLVPYSGKLPAKPFPRKSPDGKTVLLKVQASNKKERWICDGNEIKAIDDDNKTYEAIKIPPSQRGENIMDGPLPFLFGMAPERAKARYEFKFLKENDTAYAIEVTPKWKQDAIDWMKAKLILDREMCLPLEVHLFNAAGSTETVYMFKELQVNKIRFFFWTNPFEPSLTFQGYKRSVHNNPVAGGPQGPLGAGAAPIDPIAANRMPWLIGGPWKPVKQKLESLGHPVKLVRGDPATAPEQEFHIERQDPPPNAPLDKDSTIVLTLYVKMPPAQQGQIQIAPNQLDQPTRTVNKP